MRTQVFITIDTEFSIGGAFSAPTTKQPIGAQNVLGDVQGRSQALGFMLETFRAHRISATFFTETLQTAYFGDEPMGQLARRIAGEGHDLQLHLHPVWTYFDHPDWRRQLSVVAPNDNLHGRSVEQLSQWMQRGIDTFARWGLPRPVALRTGNLMVDRNVYRAMRQVGLSVASNIGCAVFEPDEAALRLNDGVHQIEGITEIPVLTYGGLRIGRRLERKSLTITGSSAGEATCLLKRAHECGSPAVVLLTHCHEFVKGDRAGALAPNRLNQRRLESLCRFLRDADDRFEVATMHRMSAAGRDRPTAASPLLSVPAHVAMARMMQNKLSDHNVI
jgi:peptidoglycan/xylan/chitin deacetylase (PgdA/CDA1 family)